jgi:hypothetical protein
MEADSNNKNNTSETATETAASSDAVLASVSVSMSDVNAADLDSTASIACRLRKAIRDSTECSGGTYAQHSLALHLIHCCHTRHRREQWCLHAGYRRGDVGRHLRPKVPVLCVVMPTTRHKTTPKQPSSVYSRMTIITSTSPHLSSAATVSCRVFSGCFNAAKRPSNLCSSFGSRSSISRNCGKTRSTSPHLPSHQSTATRTLMSMVPDMTVTSDVSCLFT